MSSDALGSIRSDQQQLVRMQNIGDQSERQLALANATRRERVNEYTQQGLQSLEAAHKELAALKLNRGVEEARTKTLETRALEIIALKNEVETQAEQIRLNDLELTRTKAIETSALTALATILNNPNNLAAQQAAIDQFRKEQPGVPL